MDLSLVATNDVLVADFLLCLKRRNLRGLTRMTFVRENCIFPPNT